MPNLIPVTPTEWEAAHAFFTEQDRLFAVNSTYQKIIKFKDRKQAEHSFIQVEGQVFAIANRIAASSEGGYDLCLMTDLPNGDIQKAEKGKLYLSPNGDYVVRDHNDVVQRDNLSGEEGMDLTELNDLQNKLKNSKFKNAILKITSERGLTRTRHLLGEGTFGKVRMVQNKDGRNFAVKIEGRGLRGENDAETKIMKILSYLIGEGVRKILGPNKKFKDESVKEKLYTVTELREGKELLEHLYKDIGEEIETHKLLEDPSESLVIALKACEATQTLHSRNIIHGDIKPANFMINKEGETIIVESVDFGCSLILEPPETEIALDDAQGTPTYMAPENKLRSRITQKFTYSFASDIYALGKIFQRDLLLTQSNDPNVRTLVTQMTSTSPADRPKMNEIIDILTTAIEHPTYEPVTSQTMEAEQKGQVMEPTMKMRDLGTTVIANDMATTVIANDMATTVIAPPAAAFIEPKKNINTQLLEAVKAYDIATVTTLLATKPKPDLDIIDDPHNETLLMLAIKNKTVHNADAANKIIKLLIENETDFNRQNKNDNTVLMLAINKGVPNEIAINLINKSTQLELKNKNGSTALLLAIKNASENEIINKLIDKGANVNHKNNQGDTALLLAIKNSSEDEIINKLIGKGANVNHKNNKGDTALMLAIEYHSSKAIISALLNKTTNVDQQNKTGDTALTLAIKAKASPTIIKALINKSNNLNNLDNAFILSIAHYPSTIAQAFIDKDNAVPRNKKSALLLASRYNKLDIVDMLTVTIAIPEFMEKWNENALKKSYLNANRNIIPKINPFLYLFGQREKISDKREEQLIRLSGAINALKFSSAADKVPLILHVFETIGYIRAQLKKESNWLGSRLDKTLDKIEADLNKMCLSLSSSSITPKKITEAKETGTNKYNTKPKLAEFEKQEKQKEKKDRPQK